jgi:16S rRNA (adenine1518-N6/adenine1519-N6)-dimethyltransferase
MLTHIMKKYQADKAPETEKFTHKKSLGQNFLTSDVVPKWLTEAGEVTSIDTVLEIGPGTGALTSVLLSTGAKVIAIEADVRTIPILEEKFATAISTKQLTLIHGDARTLDVATIGLKHHTFKVVANIPYYLSGFLLRCLLESTTQPTILVFLMQKEVVERIAREPKESILSLSVKVFGEVKYIKTVTRGHFNPPPKVDSAILQVKNIDSSRFANKNEQDLFFTLLHLGFGQKRKQLQANLSPIYGKTAVATALSSLNIKSDARAETLILDKWVELTKYFSDIPTISTVKHTF